MSSSAIKQEKLFVALPLSYSPLIQLNKKLENCKNNIYKTKKILYLLYIMSKFVKILILFLFLNSKNCFSSSTNNEDNVLADNEFCRHFLVRDKEALKMILDARQNDPLALKSLMLKALHMAELHTMPDILTLGYEGIKFNFFQRLLKQTILALGQESADVVHLFGEIKQQCQQKPSLAITVVESLLSGSCQIDLQKFILGLTDHTDKLYNSIDFSKHSYFAETLKLYSTVTAFPNTKIDKVTLPLLRDILEIGFSKPAPLSTTTRNKKVLGAIRKAQNSALLIINYMFPIIRGDLAACVEHQHNTALEYYLKAIPAKSIGLNIFDYKSRRVAEAFISNHFEFGKQRTDINPRTLLGNLSRQRHEPEAVYAAIKLAEYELGLTPCGFPNADNLPDAPTVKRQLAVLEKLSDEQYTESHLASMALIDFYLGRSHTNYQNIDRALGYIAKALENKENATVAQPFHLRLAEIYLGLYDETYTDIPKAIPEIIKSNRLEHLYNIYDGFYGDEFWNPKKSEEILIEGLTQNQAVFKSIYADRLFKQGRLSDARNWLEVKHDQSRRTIYDEYILGIIYLSPDFEDVNFEKALKYLLLPTLHDFRNARLIFIRFLFLVNPELSTKQQTEIATHFLKAKWTPQTLANFVLETLNPGSINNEEPKAKTKKVTTPKKPQQKGITKTLASAAETEKSSSHSSPESDFAPQTIPEDPISLEPASSSSVMAQMEEAPIASESLLPITSNSRSIAASSSTSVMTHPQDLGDTPHQGDLRETTSNDIAEEITETEIENFIKASQSIKIEHQLVSLDNRTEKFMNNLNQTWSWPKLAKELQNMGAEIGTKTIKFPGISEVFTYHFPHGKVTTFRIDRGYWKNLKDMVLERYENLRAEKISRREK